MDNIIAGIIGVGMVVVFLGFYAIKLNSIPLWIILGGIIVMAVIEFFETIKEDNGLNGK